ncbi:MAG TPA: alanine--tRNA ligase [Terriglobia bacterium]|nr:alanine--tRNA ligase [Terriglobia bacterium]
MTSDKVRQTFIDFFRNRGHKVVPSSSLVPAGDATLLFTNAGMNQFKDVFLGREKRDYVRATTCQKCVRAGGKHNDLEQVGRTARHHTFFEMLGNFSFGDYFKADAIRFAWDLITNPTEGYNISADKLYATIFGGHNEYPRDAEAYDRWRAVGVPAGRIFELGMKDNFWQMGDTGPCGPCSEIHYDQGAAARDLGHTDCKFPCDCGRYVELWNLVFMQFNRDEGGLMTPLPNLSIDTGAGLERISAVLQGKISNFDTDLFRPLIEEAALMAKVEYGANHETDVSLRIIADHARASTFLISDGVLPSNEGRGYVLRRILRRALYHGQRLGLEEPFLFRLSGRVVDMMKVAYPELLNTSPFVARAVRAEEEKYARTTREGLQRLRQVPVLFWRGYPLRETFEAPFAAFEEAVPTGSDISTLPQAKRSNRVIQHDTPWEIPGDELFKLYDTYGLPIDFVEDVVSNLRYKDNIRDIEPPMLDREGYEAEMQKQRERARASWKGAEKKAASPDYLKLAEAYKTEFLGYTESETRDSRILGLMVKGAPVSEVAAGTEVEIILDRTPFYAESGGQIGDTGYLAEPGSSRHVAEISDTYRPVTGITAHKAVARETLRVGDLVTARIDAERREAIVRNHTATHLLHAALRKVLGTHVKQAGSLVAPDHLRFDFSHYASVDHQDLTDIEDLVNEHTLSNEEIRTEVMGIEQALASGAMALFGEKYGDRVRVVSIGDGSFSKELCGGTHVERTGEIGLFKVTSEGSVSAGTRRVEALSGTGLLENMRRRMALLHEIEARFKTKPDDLIATLERLEESEKKARKQLEAQASQQASRQAVDLARNAQEIDGIKVVFARIESVGSDPRAAMRQIVDDLRPRLGSGVAVLGSVTDGKVALLASVSKDLTNRLDAGKIVRAAAAMVDGSGGGRKDLAEAGGKSPEKLPALMEALPGIVAEMLK